VNNENRMASDELLSSCHDLRPTSPISGRNTGQASNLSRKQQLIKEKIQKIQDMKKSKFNKLSTTGNTAITTTSGNGNNRSSRLYESNNQSLASNQ